MWPRCIVTNFIIIKPTRCTTFTNLFWHETLHVSDSSSVHHQQFIHCRTLSNCKGKIPVRSNNRISVAQPHLFHTPDSWNDFIYNERFLWNTSAPLPRRISVGLTLIFVCHLLTLAQSTAAITNDIVLHFLFIFVHTSSTWHQTCQYMNHIGELHACLKHLTYTIYSNFIYYKKL
jgi:hypothetical protein